MEVIRDKKRFMRKNIFIVGKICSGKTTVSNYLSATYGYRQLSLAGPIKEIEKDLNDGISFQEIYEEHIGKYIHFHPEDQATMFKIFDQALEIPRETPKPRRRLQFIGTEGFRNQIDDSFWIKLAHRKTQQGSESSWIIDDVRFGNEYMFFIRHAWIALGLRVSSDVQESRICSLYGAYDSNILNHPSELGIDELLALRTTTVIDGDQPKEIMPAQVKDHLCV